MAFYQLLICHGILITDSVKILIHMLGEMMFISCSFSWKIVLKSYQACMHMEVLKACNGTSQNFLGSMLCTYSESFIHIDFRS